MKSTDTAGARRERSRLPRHVRSLLWVRALNQVGSYTLPYLAVYAGPRLSTAVLGVFGVGALVSRWLGAFLVLRWSPRVVVSTGLASTGGALVLLLLARGPLAVVAAAGLVGLAFEIYEPATYEAFARAAIGAERHRSYRLLNTVLIGAGALSGLVSAVLLPLGTHWLILTDAATCLAAAVLSWRRLPAELSASRGGFLRTKRWRPPSVLICLTAAGTIFAIGYLAVVMFAPLVLLERGAAAWVPGCVLMACAAISPLLSAIRARTFGGRTRSRGLEIELTVAAIIGAILAAVPGVICFSAVYILWSAACASLLAGWSARVAESAPVSERTLWFALHGSSWAFAQTFLPALVALLSPLVREPSGAAMLIAPAALASSALVLLAFASPTASG